MVKKDLVSRIDSQIIDDPVLDLKVRQLRARNQREAERKTIKRVVYSICGGSALLFGGIFLYKHPEYLSYVHSAGHVVTKVINGFYR